MARDDVRGDTIGKCSARQPGLVTSAEVDALQADRCRHLGGTHRPPPFGPRGGGKTITIAEQELRVSLKVVDVKGMEVYTGKSTTSTPRSFTSTTDDVAGEMTAAMWSRSGPPSISPLARRTH